MVDKKSVLIVSGCAAALVALGAAAYYYISGSEGINMVERIKKTINYVNVESESGDYSDHVELIGVEKPSLASAQAYDLYHAPVGDYAYAWPYKNVLHKYTSKIAYNTVGTHGSHQNHAHTKPTSESYSEDIDYVLNETYPAVEVKNQLNVSNATGNHIGMSINHSKHNTNMKYNIFKRAKRNVKNIMKDSANINSKLITSNVSNINMKFLLDKRRNFTLKDEKRGQFSRSGIFSMRRQNGSKEDKVKKYIPHSKRNVFPFSRLRATTKRKIKMSNKKFVDTLEKLRRKKGIHPLLKQKFFKRRNPIPMNEWTYVKKCLNKLRKCFLPKMTNTISAKDCFDRLSRDDVRSMEYGHYLNNCIRRKRRQLAQKCKRLRGTLSNGKKIKYDYIKKLSKNIENIKNNILRDNREQYSSDNNSKAVILLSIDDGHKKIIYDDTVFLQDHNKTQTMHSNASELLKYMSNGKYITNNDDYIPINDVTKRTKRQYNSQINDEDEISNHVTNNPNVTTESIQENIQTNPFHLNISINRTDLCNKNDFICEKRKIFVKYFHHLMEQIPIKQLITDNTKLADYIGEHSDKVDLTHFVETILQFIPTEEVNRVIDPLISNPNDDSTTMENLKLCVKRIISLIPTDILLYGINKSVDTLLDKYKIVISDLVLNENHDSHKLAFNTKIPNVNITHAEFTRYNSDSTEISTRANNHTSGISAVSEENSVHGSQVHHQDQSSLNPTENVEEVYLNALQNEMVVDSHSILRRNPVAYSQVSTESPNGKEEDNRSSIYKSALAEYIGKIIQHIPISDLIAENDEVSQNFEDTSFTDTKKLTTYIEGVLRKIPVEVISKSIDYVPSKHMESSTSEKDKIISYVESAMKIPINELIKDLNKTKQVGGNLPSDQASLTDYIRGLVEMIPADKLPPNVAEKGKDHENMSTEDREALIEHVRSILHQFMSDDIFAELKKKPTEINYRANPKTKKLRRKKRDLLASTVQRIKTGLVQNYEQMNNFYTIFNKNTLKNRRNTQMNKLEDNVHSMSEESKEEDAWNKSWSTSKNIITENNSDSFDFSKTAENEHEIKTELSSTSMSTLRYNMLNTLKNKTGKLQFLRNNSWEVSRENNLNNETLQVIIKSKSVEENATDGFQNVPALNLKEPLVPHSITVNSRIWMKKRRCIPLKSTCDEENEINDALERSLNYEECPEQETLALSHGIGSNSPEVTLAIFCLVLFFTALFVLKMSKTWVGARRFFGCCVSAHTDDDGRVGAGGDDGGGGDAGGGLVLDAMSSQRAYVTAPGDLPAEKGDAGVSYTTEAAPVHMASSWSKWKHVFHVTPVGDDPTHGGMGAAFASAP